MEIADSKKERVTISTSLEIRLESLHTNKKKITTTSTECYSYRHFDVDFFVSVHLDGANKETEDCLAVLATVEMPRYLILHNVVLSWIVSIIDIDGNSRLPQSFVRDFNRDV
ncbi:hypothetical protein AVEN_211284-1 [Araneus ventricosus]|uniref:Uncharacterized protein n=1 Tax=Araneus ventricosus TaxID=182803 RepID=A0A4Y2HNW0_ARAVE|nr:hypothetical protein AVEN_211284-1 [Araneus ventricosus]